MNKSKKLIIFIGLIVLLVMLLVINDLRWNYKENNVTHITVITEAKYGEEWERIIAGAKAAASEYGIEIKLLAPDYEKAYGDQINLLQTAKEQKTDGIIIAPIDENALSSTLLELVDSGLPVLSIVTPVKSLGYVEYIGSDQYVLGERLGAMVVSAQKDDDTIALISTDENDPNMLQREQGFRDYVTTNSHQKIIETYRSVKDPYSATKIAEAILVANEADVIVGLDRITTIGISEAMKVSTQPVQTYGVDISKEIISAIETEYMSGIMVQNYFDIGYLSVAAMVNHIENNRAIITKTVAPYEVTMDNLYSKESQMILFPIK